PGSIDWYSREWLSGNDDHFVRQPPLQGGYVKRLAVLVFGVLILQPPLNQREVQPRKADHAQEAVLFQLLHLVIGAGTFYEDHSPVAAEQFPVRVEHRADQRVPAVLQLLECSLRADHEFGEVELNSLRDDPRPLTLRDDFARRLLKKDDEGVEGVLGLEVGSIADCLRGIDLDVADLDAGHRVDFKYVVGVRGGTGQIPSRFR